MDFAQIAVRKSVQHVQIAICELKTVELLEVKTWNTCNDVIVSDVKGFLEAYERSSLVFQGCPSLNIGTHKMFQNLSLIKTMLWVLLTARIHNSSQNAGYRQRFPRNSSVEDQSNKHLYFKLSVQCSSIISSLKLSMEFAYFSVSLKI